MPIRLFSSAISQVNPEIENRVSWSKLCSGPD